MMIMRKVEEAMMTDKEQRIEWEMEKLSDDIERKGERKVAEKAESSRRRKYEDEVEGGRWMKTRMKRRS